MFTLLDFMDDEQLFAPHFRGDSWKVWKTVLRAAYGLEMGGADLATFAEIAGGRRAPERPVRELVIAAGRGAGKDSVAAAIATYIACTADTSRLRKG